MRFFKIILLIISCYPLFSVGQQSDYFTTREVKKYRFDRLKLESGTDAAKFLKEPEQYNFIEALKLEGQLDLTKILHSMRGFNSLRELDIADCASELMENSFDSCKELEVLYLRLDIDDLEKLKFLRSLPQLKSVYLFVQGKTDSFGFINYMPALSEFHLITDLHPNNMSDLFKAIGNQTFLTTLGLSLDRVTDLPEIISKSRYITRVIIYDHRSLISNNYKLDELKEENLDILYHISNDLISGVRIQYLSQDDHLVEYEKNHLKSIYKGQASPLNTILPEPELTPDDIRPFKPEFEPRFSLSSEFNPIYQTLSNESETFMIQPGSDNMLYSTSGLRLSIPASAFVDEKGELVKDPVYIKITPYRDPIDLFVAGLVPQHDRYRFNPTYMLNISATSSTGQAILKNGYQMKVFIPKASDSSVFHFFDYESGTWQDMNLYERVFANDFIPTDFHKLEKSESTHGIYLLDTSAFDSRFQSGNNFYLADKDLTQQKLFKKKKFFTDLDRPWNKNYSKNLKSKSEKLKEGKSYIRIEKVIPKKREKNLQYFKVIDKTNQLFPELKAFKNIDFYVPIDPENKKEFREKYTRKVKFSDIRIYYNSGDDFCEMIFKTPEGYRSLKAFITTETNPVKKIKKLKKFDKTYRKYLRIADVKGKEFNQLNFVRFREYARYCDERIEELKKDRSFSEFKLHQLGTFGMFYPLETDFTVNMIISYTDLSGLPLDVKSLYMMDERYNSLFSIKPGNLQFHPDHIQYIFATDYAGNLYYANKSDIEVIRYAGNNSLTYLKLKKVGPEITSIMELRTLIRN